MPPEDSDVECMQAVDVDMMQDNIVAQDHSIRSPLPCM